MRWFLLFSFLSAGLYQKGKVHYLHFLCHRSDYSNLAIVSVAFFFFFICRAERIFKKLYLISVFLDINQNNCQCWTTNSLIGHGIPTVLIFSLTALGHFTVCITPLICVCYIKFQLQQQFITLQLLLHLLWAVSQSVSWHDDMNLAVASLGTMVFLLMEQK